MSEYSVAEARNGLPGLIDKARDGEQIIITRHGRPVAELRPTLAATPGEARTYGWLKARRLERMPVSTSSVELLRALYEDDD